MQDEEKPSLDELIHFGVKGMKWGKRKHKVSGDLVLKKGTNIHRMSTVARETDEGHAYAAYKDSDIKKYRKTFEILGQRNKSFDLSFKATKDLISPSEKTRVDAFVKLLDDPSFSSNIKKMQKRLFILNIGTPETKAMANKYENLDPKKAKAYKLLNFAIAGDKNLRDRYFKELADLGYNMIIDEADSKNGISESPIIIFDRKGSLEFISADKIK